MGVHGKNMEFLFQHFMNNLSDRRSLAMVFSLIFGLGLGVSCGSRRTSRSARSPGDGSTCGGTFHSSSSFSTCS